MNDSILLDDVLEWMMRNGLLNYDHTCTRPDGTCGPAWVLRRPAIIDADAVTGWSATTARDAVEDAFRGKT